MHLLIDLQACQTSGSRNRGIGRYSLSLARAMAELGAGHHRVSVMLSDRFPETVAELRAAFAPLVGGENVHLLALPPGCRDMDPTNVGRVVAAEKLRLAFISGLSPDAVHVASLFEGFADDAVVSIEPAPDQTFSTAATLYDLIPYLNPDVYLAESYTRRWYLRRLQQARNADRLLAISESSRSEALKVLGCPSDRVVNISSAIDGHFRPLAPEELDAAEIRGRYGIVQGFLLYTGGIDFRKNIEGLIRAYSLLPAQVRRNYQLVIVCGIRDQDKQRLLRLGRKYGLGGNELLFTGFVSEQDLVALYNLATLFVFPSLHEGFGLPVLEAMACGTPTIGSNRSSIPEVLGLVDALFDPTDAQDMAAVMTKGLQDSGYRSRLRAHGLQQASKFSWRETGRRALEAIESSVEIRTRPVVFAPSSRHRLAYVSPLPPQRSGIADYSAGLLPELARYYDIELVSDEPSIADDRLTAAFPVRTAAWFLEHCDRYDRVLYHMGNSHFHAATLGLMRSVPGVVMLHDYYMSGLLNHVQSFRLDAHAFTTAMVRSHGYAGLRMLGEQGSTAALMAYPANRVVIDNAMGVMVHSRFAIDRAGEDYGPAMAKRFGKVPFPCRPPDEDGRTEARLRLGLTEYRWVICSFGFLAPTKLNLELIEAWKLVGLDRHGDALLVFVGGHASGEYGEMIEHALAEATNIRITGYLDHKAYADWLHAADIGVQLRNFSRGETSAAIFDCLGHGAALIYNAHGTSAELPEGLGVRLGDPVSPSMLGEALRGLIDDSDRCRELARAGRDFVKHAHAPELTARGYYQYIEASYQSSSIASEQALLAELEKVITGDPGGTWSEHELRRLATAIALNRRDGSPPRLLLDIGDADMHELGSLLSELVDALPRPWQLECVKRTEDSWVTARTDLPHLFGQPGGLLDEEILPRHQDCWLKVVGPAVGWASGGEFWPPCYPWRAGWLAPGDLRGDRRADLIDWLVCRGGRPDFVRSWPVGVQ